MPYPEKEPTYAQKLGFVLGFVIIVCTFLIVLGLCIAGVIAVFRFIF